MLANNTDTSEIDAIQAEIDQLDEAFFTAHPSELSEAPTNEEVRIAFLLNVAFFLNQACNEMVMAAKQPANSMAERVLVTAARRHTAQALSGFDEVCPQAKEDADYWD